VHPGELPEPYRRLVNQGYIQASDLTHLKMASAAHLKAATSG
jgi:hypothetical protein